MLPLQKLSAASVLVNRKFEKRNVWGALSKNYNRVEKADLKTEGFWKNFRY